MKRILPLFSGLLFAGTAPLLAQTALPGSGNAYTFSGAVSPASYISIPHVSGQNEFGLGANFSIDMWVKIPASQPDVNLPDNEILGKWVSGFASSYSYVFRVLNATNPTVADRGKLIFLRYDQPNGTSKGIQSVSPLNDNNWHHVAATRTGGGSGTFTLYVDGISQGTFADFTTNVSNANPVLVGMRAGGNNRFAGSVDEIRFWNIGLSQAQIRDRICRKITSSDPLAGNLTAYYKFDEASGTVATDSLLSGGTRNNGTIQTGVARAVSGAAIGDASAHDYVNATKTASLTPSAGNGFSITSTSGNPDGVHIYYINATPNATSGTVGVGNNRNYFGVYQVLGSNPQYTAVYNYNGNPYVDASNETSLVLYRRSDNTTATWSDAAASQNTVAKTLTVAGQRTEYILGNTGPVPLPIKLLSFRARVLGNSDALLQWQDGSEGVDILRFDVERSNDGQNFRCIGTVTGTGRRNHLYSFTDAGGIGDKTYYRLNTKGADGSATYSNTLALSLGQQGSIPVSVFPNPATDRIAINGLESGKRFSITDLLGQEVWLGLAAAGTISLDVSGLKKGIYHLRYLQDGVLRQTNFIVR